MKEKILLVVIVVLGAFLRFFWLGDAPDSALIDEANFGYIAYSLLHTGADEHGQSWPLIFKAFGDQKLPVYGYLLIPVVALFDLSVFSIRVPSALAGTISIWLLYLLTKQITSSKKAGLSAALIMAVSPWPLVLSRFGFESNVALMFWLVGLLGLTRIKEKMIWTYLAAISFALTWYTYIAYRPVSLGLVLLIAALLWFQDKKLRRKLVILLGSFFLLITPLLLGSAGSSGLARFEQIGVFYDEGVVMRVNEHRNFCINRYPQKLCYLAYNKGTVLITELAHSYFLIFSPQYLATQGDKSAYLTVPYVGQFFFYLYPFFILSVSYMLSNKLRLKQPYFRWLLLVGLILAPLPSVIAGGAQKVRLSVFMPFVIIAMVFGMLLTWRKIINFLLKNKKYLPLSIKKVKLFMATSSIITLLLTTGFFFVTLTSVQIYAKDFVQNSYVPGLMLFLDQYDETHKIIIKPSFSDPLMYFAFYTKMDPEKYQALAELGPLE